MVSVHSNRNPKTIIYEIKIPQIAPNFSYHFDVPFLSRLPYSSTLYPIPSRFKSHSEVTEVTSLSGVEYLTYSLKSASNYEDLTNFSACTRPCYFKNKYLGIN